MSRPQRRRTAGATVIACTLLAGAVLGACSDDDDEPSAADDAGVEDIEVPTSTTVEIESGGIEVPDLPGTLAIPVPALGFGIAIPENWQASLLTPEALERLAGIDTGQVAFVDAAVETARTGAVFYAAGIDGEGRVSELKLFRDDAEATTLDDLRTIAEDLDTGSDAVEVGEREVAGRTGIVVRFTVDDETVDGEAVRTSVSQLLVGGDGAVWSVVITAEDPATLDLLEGVFFDSFTLA